MLRSFRGVFRRRTGEPLASSGGVDGESSSGGHLALIGLPVETTSVLAAAPPRLGVSSGSVFGGQEIFSLRVSVGLSAFSEEPCPRASMVAVRTLTLAKGESSTLGLSWSEGVAGLWAVGLVTDVGEASALSFLPSQSSLCGRWPKPSS